MKLKIAAFALFTALSSSSVFAAATCPADLDKTQCVYFKEGYAAGADDKKTELSNNYRRHEDSYDSRYETAYSKGYQIGYKETNL